jgi:hypothetical protein
MVAALSKLSIDRKRIFGCMYGNAQKRRISETTIAMLMNDTRDGDAATVIPKYLSRPGLSYIGYPNKPK